jgi:hypothetical protein
MSAFGTGSNSNGQFWFGGSSFPGFLYKKNAGVGGRRSTKFNPGGNITCNSETYLYNKYKPGAGGVGASSMSNRRAKNRLATICSSQQCFPCFNTLGQYSNYTHNPNGFIPCPATPNSSPTSPTPSPTDILFQGNINPNMNTSGMTPLAFLDNDEGFAYLPFAGMDFYFFDTNFGNSDGTDKSSSIYISANGSFGFGPGYVTFEDWPVDQPAILFDFFDSVNLTSYVSPPQNGTTPGVKFVRIVVNATDFVSFSNNDTTIKKKYEIFYVRDNFFQYIQFICNAESVDRSVYPQNTTALFANGSNITDGVSFKDTFGPIFSIPDNGPTQGNSYVIRSNLQGSNWQFFPNTYLNI